MASPSIVPCHPTVAAILRTVIATRLFGRLRAQLGGARALTRMLFRRDAARWWVLPRSAYDYRREVGDGTGSATVMAPLHWIMRSFPEAPPALYWRDPSTGLEEQIYDHPMLRLLRRPNRHFSGPVLWMATVGDWFVDGNAYWAKVRDVGGRVRELWWVPSWMVEPRGDETELVTAYEYRPGGGRTVPLRPDDVIHFRFGLDPDDPRRGRSPLRSVLREVFTDDEAATFTAAMLRNMGVPGLIIAPDGDFVVSGEDAEATREYVRAMFTGDHRGEALVMRGPTKVQQFGFSPEQLTLKDLRRIPEERVSAVIGVPAIVAGLGAGLDRSTFANYAEAREAAYEQAIIPTQALLAEELWFQLLPEFVAETELWQWRVGFDLNLVRVLQEDRLNLAKRLDLGVRGGWARVSEARRAAGLPVDPMDEVYLRQLNVGEVPVSSTGGSENGRRPGVSVGPEVPDARAR